MHFQLLSNIIMITFRARVILSILFIVDRAHVIAVDRNKIKINTRVITKNKNKNAITVMTTDFRACHNILLQMSTHNTRIQNPVIYDI